MVFPCVKNVVNLERISMTTKEEQIGAELYKNSIIKGMAKEIVYFKAQNKLMLKRLEKIWSIMPNGDMPLTLSDCYNDMHKIARETIEEVKKINNE